MLTVIDSHQPFTAHSLFLNDPQVPVASSPEPEHSTAGKRCFPHKSKRRRLAKQSGFVPVSSLRTCPLGSWLEAPQSTASCSSSSSSSSSSSPSSSSSYLRPVSILQPRPNETNTSASLSPAVNADSLSFLTEEERRWLNGDEGGTAGMKGRLADFSFYTKATEMKLLLSTIHKNRNSASETRSCFHWLAQFGLLCCFGV